MASSHRAASLLLVVATLTLAGCTGNGADDDAANVACAHFEGVPHDAMTHIQEITNEAGPSFVPDNVAVQAGTWVLFTNTESIPHTATPDDENAWGDKGSDMMEEGDTYAWCAERPGTYTYHCLPHATKLGSGRWTGMAGTIVVTA